MKATIFINGIIGKDTSLLDVIRQFKSFKNVSELEVHIDSIGGLVDEGQSIFTYLRGLKLPITTIAKEAYSIAASIFMAGDQRILENSGKPFMIHLPSAMVEGNSEQLDFVSKELKAIETEFSNFYSKYTSIDKQTIKTLLTKETYMTAEEAVSMGFATGIKEPLKAVAIFKKEDFQTNDNTIMTKAEALIKTMSKYFSTNVEYKALVLQDATGREINFPDVQEGDSPEVGVSKAEIAGNHAEGEFLSPEGATWVFAGGILIEVKPKMEDEPAEDAPEAEAKKEDDFDMEKFIQNMETALFAKFNEQSRKETEALKNEILAIKKMVGSASIEIKAQDQTNKSKSTNYLR